MKFIAFALFAFSTSFNAFALEITCNGTEPFWTLDSNGKSLKFDNFQGPRPQILDVLSIRESDSSRPGKIAQIIQTATSTLTAVEDAECSDGMSDAVYSHDAVYESNGISLSGCCNFRK